MALRESARQVAIHSKHIDTIDASSEISVNNIGPVVKLEFTPACQAGGRGFESRRDRWFGGNTESRSGSSVGRARA